MPGNIELLTEVIKQLLLAERRYKDGYSDDVFSDAEMFANKLAARENALITLRAMGIKTEGL